MNSDKGDRQVARNDPGTRHRQVARNDPGTRHRQVARDDPVSARNTAHNRDAHQRLPLSDVIRLSCAHRLDREGNRIGVSFIHLPIYSATIYHLPIHANDTAQAKPVTLARGGRGMG